MKQKLILPITDTMVSASINTDAYYSRFGYHHYGTDIISISKQRYVYASGNGEVVGLGYDNACGNVLVIVYKNAYNQNLDKWSDVIFRYMHLASVNVKQGDSICIGQFLGEYGGTGAYAGAGKHLHIEADLDTKNYLYTPTVNHSNYLKGTLQGAYDYKDKRNTLRNILEFLYLGEGQSYATTKDSYIRVEDMNIKAISTSDMDCTKEAEEVLILTQKLDRIKSIIMS